MPPQQGQLPLPAGGLPHLPSALWPTSVDNLALGTGFTVLPMPPSHQQAILRWHGGEGAALERLKHYVWDSGAVATYHETRNGLLGSDDSTKLSPWLAEGCLSPRRVWTEIARFEQERSEKHHYNRAPNENHSESTPNFGMGSETRHGMSSEVNRGVHSKGSSGVCFHLLVRDYWQFLALHHGRHIFLPGGVTGQARPEWHGGDDAVKRWQQGTTGVPFIDANMRELFQTGWMSNRGRQNVAAYLAADVAADWRRGAAWFEAKLVDHDAASNWGNWVCAAGFGTSGKASNFDVVKQGKTYDPQGTYIRQWVPELRDVPTKHVHAPWLMDDATQAVHGMRIPEDYPHQIPGTKYCSTE